VGGGVVTGANPIAPDRPSPLLSVRGLRVAFATPAGRVEVVSGVDLDIAQGERLALVGESGSGKSVTGRALMRLDHDAIVAGSISYRGRELTELSEKAMRSYRGAALAMVFQDPLSALNPTMTIGAQITEALRMRGTSRRAADALAVSTLEELEVADAKRRLRAYPHEFSGGMRQRVCLAMALVGEPDLLIADEPTTALDVRVQGKVLDLLDEVSRRRGLSVLLITHDLGVVAGFADRVAVLYSGRVVERADVFTLFAGPVHPYSRGLLEAVPRIDVDQQVLASVPGVPPSPAARPAGCAFHPRCALATDVCREQVPVLTATGSGNGLAACHVRAPQPLSPGPAR
jgi:oligopeptide/dipeptide ABC transporter ATP-binding protein